MEGTAPEPDVQTQPVVPSESAGTQTAAGAPSEQAGAGESISPALEQTGGVVDPAAAALSASIGATAGDQVASPAAAPPEPSAPIQAQETAQAAAGSEGQVPAESSPVAAEGTPGASLQQPAAAVEASAPDPGYLGHAPGDPGFVPGPGDPTDHSSGVHLDSLAKGFLGARASDGVDVVVDGRHVVLPAATVAIDSAAVEASE